jgi:cell division protein FtsI/penicillin-binding protein 2
VNPERRLRILGLVVLLVFGAAWLRAAQLTTVSANDLRGKLADGRQPQTIAAPRGTITDRSGNLLAISESAADVSADPLIIKNPTQVAAQLSAIVDVPEADLYDKLTQNRGFVWIARMVSGADAKKIRALGIGGVDLWPRTRRQYPQDTVASQLIGFTGVDGQGLTGIEAELDKSLRGTDGKRLLVRGRGGANAKVVYIKDEQPTKPGKSVKLSIDARIQAKAEDVLGEAATTFAPKSATAVVMQPSTGKVLAMASWPKVDANDAGGAPASARQVKAAAFTYEPGSTFKPFTVAGALEENKVQPDTNFTIPDQYKVADTWIHDSHEHGTINLDTGGILAQSSNIGTIQIAQRLGETQFDQWIRKFGFGQKTGIELPDDERGKIIDVKDYSGTSIGNLPIGQGELVTPLQLASGYSTFANDGVRHQPTLVDAINGKDVKRPAGTRVVSAKTAREIRDMLTKTTETGGTAAGVQINGYKVASKTGTANVVVPGQAEYSKTLYTSSLIGMAPADRPKIVVAVIVEQPSRGGIFGATVAGPAFKKLTSWTLNYLGVAPN